MIIFDYLSSHYEFFFLLIKIDLSKERRWTDERRFFFMFLLLFRKKKKWGGGRERRQITNEFLIVKKARSTLAVDQRWHHLKLENKRKKLVFNDALIYIQHYKFHHLVTYFVLANQLQCLVWSVVITIGSIHYQLTL